MTVHLCVQRTNVWGAEAEGSESVLDLTCCLGTGLSVKRQQQHVKSITKPFL